MDPGCRVNSRAGVGAGGLSPSSSFAGSFIFLGRVGGVLSRVFLRRADGGCVGFSSVARLLSRAAGFFAAGLDIWYKEAVWASAARF